MNAGQMLYDVRLAVEGKKPITFYGRMGGVIPLPDEILEQISSLNQDAGK
jgi:2-oxoglutarate ferredoxin oxidoreductase subunit alpha